MEAALAHWDRSLCILLDWMLMEAPPVHRRGIRPTTSYHLSPSLPHTAYPTPLHGIGGTFPPQVPTKPRHTVLTNKTPPPETNQSSDSHAQTKIAWVMCGWCTRVPASVCVFPAP
jgi:hypothetical protein